MTLHLKPSRSRYCWRSRARLGPERALVLCVDEKPQIQAAQGTAPAFPMQPGQAERRTHDYAGTARWTCSPRST